MVRAQTCGIKRGKVTDNLQVNPPNARQPENLPTPPTNQNAEHNDRRRKEKGPDRRPGRPDGSRETASRRGKGAGGSGGSGTGGVGKDGGGGESEGGGGAESAGGGGEEKSGGGGEEKSGGREEKSGARRRRTKKRCWKCSGCRESSRRYCERGRPRKGRNRAGHAGSGTRSVSG